MSRAVVTIEWRRDSLAKNGEHLRYLRSLSQKYGLDIITENQDGDNNNEGNTDHSGNTNFIIPIYTEQHTFSAEIGGWRYYMRGEFHSTTYMKAFLYDAREYFSTRGVIRSTEIEIRD